jgi:hypothetical protein
LLPQLTLALLLPHQPAVIDRALPLLQHQTLLPVPHQHQQHQQLPRLLCLAVVPVLLLLLLLHPLLPLPPVDQTAPGLHTLYLLQLCSVVVAQSLQAPSKLLCQRCCLLVAEALLLAALEAAVLLPAGQQNLQAPHHHTMQLQQVAGRVPASVLASVAAGFLQDLLQAHCH